MAKLRCTSAASPRLPDLGGFCLGYCAVPDFVHDMASIECRVYACYFSDVDSEHAFIASAFKYSAAFGQLGFGDWLLDTVPE